MPALVKHAWLAILISGAALPGCAEIRVHRGVNVSDAMGERAEQSHSEAGFGLKALSEPVILTEKCPGGWQEWTTRKTALQSALSVVTLGIYTPWTVEWVCRPAPR